MIAQVLNTLNRNKFMTKLPRRYYRKRNYSKIARLCPLVEENFNKQINFEFFASFTYLAMAIYFGRQSVALPGCHNFFMNQFQDERNHSQKLIDYLNKRGSIVVLQPIPPPTCQAWESPKTAFRDAMNLEKSISEKLFELHKDCTEVGDVCSCNLLENEFLDNQIEEYNKLARIVTQLDSIGENGLGIYLFDVNLLNQLKEDT